MENKKKLYNELSDSDQCDVCQDFQETHYTHHTIEDIDFALKSISPTELSWLEPIPTPPSPATEGEEELDRLESFNREEVKNILMEFSYDLQQEKYGGCSTHRHIVSLFIKAHRELFSTPTPPSPAIEGKELKTDLERRVEKLERNPLTTIYGPPPRDPEEDSAELKAFIESAKKMPEGKFVPNQPSGPEGKEEDDEVRRVKLKLPLGPTSRLVRWANAINGFYGAPVFLVGSQITGSDDPRDVDVICVLPDEDFELRYGSVTEWVDQGESGLWKAVRHKWSQDCVKKSKHGIRDTKLDIDFKVLPKSWSEDAYQHVNKAFPPVRLDTNPDMVYPAQPPTPPAGAERAADRMTEGEGEVPFDVCTDIHIMWLEDKGGFFFPPYQAGAIAMWRHLNSNNDTKRNTPTGRNGGGRKIRL